MQSRTKAEGAKAARFGMQLPQMLQPTTGQLIRNVARSANTGAISGAGAGTLTFATYEIFFISEFLKTLEIESSFRKKIKNIFVAYHIVWCLIVTILVLLPSASSVAYVNIFVMYGFTIWGIISK